jgi:hypothetical protein
VQRDLTRAATAIVVVGVLAAAAGAKPAPRNHIEAHSTAASGCPNAQRVAVQAGNALVAGVPSALYTPSPEATDRPFVRAAHRMIVY